MTQTLILPGDNALSDVAKLRKELAFAKEALAVMQNVIDAHSTELSAVRLLLLQAVGEAEHNEEHAIEAVNFLKARQEAQLRFNARRGQ